MSKGSSGTKKYGRMLDWCKKYKSEGRRERNKARIAKKLAKIAQKKQEKRKARNLRLAAAGGIALNNN